MGTGVIVRMFYLAARYGNTSADNIEPTAVSDKKEPIAGVEKAEVRSSFFCWILRLNLAPI